MQRVAPSLEPLPLPGRLLGAPVRALDRARWLWLKALGPLARPLVRDRELRVAVAGSSLIALSLLGAVLAPLYLLALGPIVWGVPHVLSDVRYLAVRPGLHRRPVFWLFVVTPLALTTITAEAAWGFAAAGGMALITRGPWWKRALVLGASVLLVVLAIERAFFTALALAHAHNFIGIALFWAWRRRRGALHALPLALFVAGAALILGGAFDHLALGVGAFAATPGGMGAYYHLESLAPGVPGALALRVVLLFAFAQSVHYVVWVRLVPEEDRPRETPRTFAASLRALADDCGGPFVALAGLAALGVAVWAAFDVFEARGGYLRAVLFHAHLEIAAAAMLLVEGVRPRARTGAA